MLTLDGDGLAEVRVLVRVLVGEGDGLGEWLAGTWVSDGDGRPTASVGLAATLAAGAGFSPAVTAV